MPWGSADVGGFYLLHWGNDSRGIELAFKANAPMMYRNSVDGVRSSWSQLTPNTYLNSYSDLSSLASALGGANKFTLTTDSNGDSSFTITNSDMYGLYAIVLPTKSRRATLFNLYMEGITNISSDSGQEQFQITYDKNTGTCSIHFSNLANQYFYVKHYI